MEELNVMGIVKNYIEDNRLSKASLARTLKMVPRNLLKRFKRSHVETNFLIELSYALNHNFFADVAELLQDLPKQENATIKELQNEISLLTREKELLKEIISSNLKQHL